MRYTITTPLLISDWQELRRSVFGDAQPVFEQFGGGIPYVVEFASPVTPTDLGPLVKVEVVDSPTS
jgi:hypothetical protein